MNTIQITDGVSINISEDKMYKVTTREIDLKDAMEAVKAAFDKAEDVIINPIILSSLPPHFITQRYKCKKCVKTFASEKTRRTHQRKYHPAFFGSR